MKTSKYHTRGFLNRKKGSAHYEISAESFGEKFAYACIELSDCTRNISLNFDFTDEKTKKEQLHKLTVLTQQLILFKEAVFD